MNNIIKLTVMKRISLSFVILIFSLYINKVNAQVGQWTWIHGLNTSGGAGVWGTMGVPAPGNMPPATYEQCDWADHNGDFWIFGGLNGSSYGALWRYTTSSNQWTWMKGSQTINYAGSYGTQGVPSAANNPPSRAWGAATWVDISGNFWMFGGMNAGVYSDLWKYDIVTNQWTWMKGPNTTGAGGVYGTQGVPAAANNPPSRYEVNAAWTDNSGNLWLFGGYNTYNDLWRYNIATNMWTWMKGSNFTGQAGIYGTLGVEAPANTPGARAVYAHWKDNSGNFWLFGGYSGAGFFNDLWRYNPVTNNWTWMGGPNTMNSNGVYGTQCQGSTSNIPSSRMESRAVWTDQSGTFWMFGGTSSITGSPVFNDLWNYNPATGKWTWVSGSNAPNPVGVWGTLGVPAPGNHPSGRLGNVCFGDNAGHLYFFGGSSAPFNSPYNDLWKYNIDPNCVAQTVPVVVTASANTSVCAGACANISAAASSGTPPYTYAWSPNVGSGAGPFNVCPNSATTYTVNVTDAAGTTASAAVTINVNPLPTATVTPAGPLTICAGTDVLHAGTGAGYSYQWYMNGNIMPGEIFDSLVVSGAGDYTVQITDANGCSATSIPVNVVQGQGPVVTVAASGGSCNAGVILIGYTGLPVVLTASGAGAVSYLWSTGETTQSITVTTGGNYSVIGYDANGCPSAAPGTTTVTAINVTCGHNGDKIILCHVPPGNPGNPQTICVAASAIPHHLANHPGDCIGPCSLYYAPRSHPEADPIVGDIEHAFYVNAYPNPFTGTFSLMIHTSMDSPINIRVFDLVGKMVESYNEVSENTAIGGNLKAGVYMIEAEQEGIMQRIRIVKE
jgi:hypothetical protein